MSSKNNTILLGIALLVLGVASLVQNFFFFNFGNLIFLMIGAAFFMLYKSKGKSWALVFSVYFTYYGMADFLRMFLHGDNGFILFGSAFFIVPAIIFLILFYEKNKRGLLTPGAFLLWIGIFIMLDQSRWFPYDNLGLFCICMGMAFMTIYYLGMEFVGRWNSYLGIFLLGIGFFKYVFSFFGRNLPLTKMGSVVLIIFALIILVGQRKQKN